MSPKPISSARRVLEETLSDGQWHDAGRLLRAMQRAVHPGEASREAMRQREGYKKPPSNELSMEELVDQGRRRLANVMLSTQLRTGRVETDVNGELTRAHWRDEITWKIRDTRAGWMRVGEAAQRLGLSYNAVAHWASEGYAPPPVYVSGGKFLTPELFEVYQRIAEHYPGPGKRWKVDPRSLWNPSPDMVCPHCNQPITVTVAKAL